jgi:hypothetical protein
MRSNKGPSIVSGKSKIGGGLCRNPNFGKTEQAEYRQSFDIKASTTPTTALRSWIAHNLELTPDQLWKSIVLPLNSSNEAESITTSAFPVPASSSATKYGVFFRVDFGRSFERHQVLETMATSRGNCNAKVSMM